MFVQVIRGAVSDAAAIKARGERWDAELRRGADGFVGETSGVTADGTFVLFAYFESAEAARRNSERPEQGAWWAETAKLFTDEPSFADYDDVVVVRGGPNDQAGFVQVILGTTSDPARERELTAQMVAAMATSEYSTVRPDLLGGVIGISDEGHFAQAYYFSSEAEARVGEKQEWPAEFADQFAEEERLTTEMNYFDLTDPWFQ